MVNDLKRSNYANYLIGHQERKTDFIDFLTNRHKSNHSDILTQNLYCLSQVDLVHRYAIFLCFRDAEISIIRTIPKNLVGQLTYFAQFQFLEVLRFGGNFSCGLRGCL